MPKAWEIAVAGCVHFPHADARAVGVFQKLCAQQQPKYVVLAGDILDAYHCSSHLRDPRRMDNFQHELDSTRAFLARVRSTCPRTQIVYLLGNHEARIAKYLASNAKELACLRCLTLPELLGFQELRIQHLEYGDYWQVPGAQWVITHGSAIRSAAGGSALAEMKKAGCSGVSFHTHRAAVVSETTHSAQCTWVEGGCMIDAQTQDYVKGTPNWQQACVWLTVEGETVTPELLHINQGQTVFRGCRIRA